MPDYEFHLFRVMTPHVVRRLSIDVQLPVTGFMAVPYGTTDLTQYMSARERTLAESCAPLIEKGCKNYGTTVAAMALMPSIRTSMGFNPKMPPAGLKHHSPAATCEACLAIAICTLTPAQAQECREHLELLARELRTSSQSQETIEAALNLKFCPLVN